MNFPFTSGPHYLANDRSRVRDGFGNDEVRIREQAVMFHEKEEQLLGDLKKALLEGREPDCHSALRKMEALAAQLCAEPITTLCRRGKHLMNSEHTNDQMSDLVSQLETALQGTVNLLRTKGLLQDEFETTLPIAIEKD